MSLWYIKPLVMLTMKCEKLLLSEKGRGIHERNLSRTLLCYNHLFFNIIKIGLTTKQHTKFGHIVTANKGKYDRLEKEAREGKR